MTQQQKNTQYSQKQRPMCGYLKIKQHTIQELRIEEGSTKEI